MKCKKHPSSGFFTPKGRGPRCTRCAGESVTRRRRKIKARVVMFFGGKCNRCGYDKCLEAFDVHHKDPSKKDFAISVTGVTRSWEKIEKELSKCELLCANCHREHHANC